MRLEGEQEAGQRKLTCRDLASKRPPTDTRATLPTVADPDGDRGNRASHPVAPFN